MVAPRAVRQPDGGDDRRVEVGVVAALESGEEVGGCCQRVAGAQDAAEARLRDADDALRSAEAAASSKGGDQPLRIKSSPGIILSPFTHAGGIFGLLGGYLTDHYGAKPFILTGSGLLLVGLLLLTLVAQSHTSELDLAWRLLLIGMGLGLFSGPNLTLIMSAGARETMGAASALSNLSARIGSVFGPLILSILWFILPGPGLQMSSGGIVFVALAVLSVLCAWVARPKPLPDETKTGLMLSKQGSPVSE